MNRVGIVKLFYKTYGSVKSSVNKIADKIPFVKEDPMGKNKVRIIRIKWSIPFDLDEVINKLNDGGKKPNWSGNDYGIYQIYGKHILCGENALLYIGVATENTFSGEFIEPETWVIKEEGVKIYVGRVYDPNRHTAKDNWKSWKEDVKLAEEILIYKYSPHYNGKNVEEEPRLPGDNPIRLVHSYTGKGTRHRLEREDNAPEDYSK
jgi:hypothetical protein